MLKWIIDWVSQYYWSLLRKRSSGFSWFLRSLPPTRVMARLDGSRARLAACVEDPATISLFDQLNAELLRFPVNWVECRSETAVRDSLSPAERFWGFWTGLWVIQSVTDSQCGRETLWSNTGETVSQKPQRVASLNTSRPSLNVPETINV